MPAVLKYPFPQANGAPMPDIIELAGKGCYMFSANPYAVILPALTTVFDRKMLNGDVKTAAPEIAVIDNDLLAMITLVYSVGKMQQFVNQAAGFKCTSVMIDMPGQWPKDFDGNTVAYQSGSGSITVATGTYTVHQFTDADAT